MPDLSELYTQHKSYMFHTANQILDDPQAAENIVHDAFMRIIENFQKFNLENGHKTRALIGIIVKGLARNEYNRRKRIDYSDDLPEQRDTTIAADDWLIEQSRYEELKTAILTLNDIYADTLLLRYEYHYSVKEIAGFMFVSEDTVRQRLHRAKMKLREILTNGGI